MESTLTAKKEVTIDGNEATASVAFRLNEVIAIYPITPSSGMGELSDLWSTQKKTNIWGSTPEVTEMQSEGGASGAVHGALQAGALTTTFTSSQGLLLMIPNMYKIAGELTATVFHVAARTVATHALSIFGDHSDVNACRQTGFAILASGSIQEAHDFACIAQAATLRSRVPFLHFFDGFRTSHEVNTMEELTDEDLRFMINDDLVRAHRARALTPDRPVVRGTAQNPDAFFQAREAINPFYIACPGLVKESMDQFASRTNRQYRLFDYIGHPEAERVIVMMGSGAETAHETVQYLLDRGERVGLIKVRLYRPFSAKHFAEALPRTVRKVAVLDRTKEPGAMGEPLYLDVLAALHETLTPAGDGRRPMPLIRGGRYGLSSKEFNPSRVIAVFDELQKEEPKSHFTVGILDDVTHTSLTEDPDLDIEPDDVFRGVFYGLGADGTVGANKNSIKIIGGNTPNYAQGYFVYDSKKSGAATVSHLRFGPRPIRSSYLIKQANFVACHQWVFLDRYDMLAKAKPGGVFLLNSPYPREEVWDQLPREVQEGLIEKKLRFYCIDAYSVARENGMGRRINTIMQTCFFSISGVLPQDEAIALIKDAIGHTYAGKGEEILRRNYAAVDQTLANLHELAVPAQATATRRRPAPVSEQAPDFVQKVTAMLMAGKGDELPVSAFSPDGTWPSGTARWEKRNIALEIPTWDPKICIQCNKCTFVCPHAAIRAKVFDPEALDGAPESFQSIAFRGSEFRGMRYTIQVAPEDCTGCSLCVRACPAKDKSNPRHKSLNMAPQLPLRESEAANFGFFLEIPEADRGRVPANVKGSQLLEPLFEFSGACAGCGETPYLKLLSQLFGDRLLVSNATGCSSIYGGNLPTTPYSVNREGRGPAWSNSLFEDNAEFGLGFNLAVEKTRGFARELVRSLASYLGDDFVESILDADQTDEAGIASQRERIEVLRRKLAGLDRPQAQQLEEIADYLVRKSIWIVGGDGWAYDIGFGGLDHVLALNRNVNVLVLDTEVYSNTGGQASKSTPMAATAKFAIGGKAVGKKDLGMMAMVYGHVYVAQVAFGAKDAQTVKAFLEADSYAGPSLIIAYSSCIAHGYDLAESLDHQKQATQSGLWPLYRFDPRLSAAGKNPLELDTRPMGDGFEQYAASEGRFRLLMKTNPTRARELQAKARARIKSRLDLYQQLAQLHVSSGNGNGRPSGHSLEGDTAGKENVEA